MGISSNIRASYGFLAHNYDPNPGDEIFFFGFSRGAFTARSIAGLVTKLGLLTKRGMDYFPDVYDEFYKDPGSTPDFNFSEGLLKKIGTDRIAKAKYSVKLVGVWDTVEFHGEGMSGEKIEFHNAELSTKIQYAYHAMALDERRTPYAPTLWQWPSGYVPASDGTGLQVMKQVWFSGAHSDVGGGKYDPNCSDVTLAWMIAQCHKDGKLSFVDEDPVNPDDANEYYLLPDRLKKNTNSKWSRLAKASEPDPLDTFWDSAWGAIQSWSSQDRKALVLDNTQERIHRSIRDRDLKAWPCPLLDGTQQKGAWGLKVPGKGGKALQEAEPDPISDAVEEKYINRIRPAPSQKGATKL